MLSIKQIWKYLLAIVLTLTVALAAAGCGGGAAASSSAASKAKSGEAKSGKALTVRMLDIGQGDACLLEKDGKFVLIDSGDIEHRDTIVALLKKYHVKSLSKVVITHPHADHLGGMQAIFKNFKVEAIYEALKAGDALTFFDGVSYKVLGPVKVIKDQKGNSDFNNNSIVGRLSYGNFSMMFTGDAEKEEEASILANNGTLKSDVLKVGHHGSRTSTSPDFLRAVSPKEAFISCGLNNDYRHPHKTTVAKLEKAKVHIYRTDRDGTLTLTTTGDGYKITKER